MIQYVPRACRDVAKRSALSGGPQFRTAKSHISGLSSCLSSDSSASSQLFELEALGHTDNGDAQETCGRASIQALLGRELNAIESEKFLNPDR